MTDYNQQSIFDAPDQRRDPVESVALVPWQVFAPRDWQAEALPIVLTALKAGKRGVVSAIMGAGKSKLMAELARLCPPSPGQVVVVTAPTIKLVEQLGADLRAIVGEHKVGMYYTGGKQIRSIVVCCNDSAEAMAAELVTRSLKVSLWICDEAHKSQSPQILAAHEVMQPQAAIGFTATPFRSLKTEELSLWDELLFEYGAKRAFADGVVVPPSLVHWTGGEAGLDEVCESMIKNIVRHGPGLCNALTIADAEAFARKLTAAGVRAQAIHSKQTKGAQFEIIERLRQGGNDCIIHVNMLAEGVDLPWLRWMCLRRPVGSKVRFCQEVGRGMRSSPGKDCVYILDPHDLFNIFGLTNEAVLAGQAEEAMAIAEPEEERLAGEYLRTPKEITVQGMAAMRQFIRYLYVALMGKGMVEQKVKSTAWRPFAVSDSQITTLGYALNGIEKDKRLPQVVREGLLKAADCAKSLQKGDASDLISILFSWRDWKRQKKAWPLGETDAPEADNPLEEVPF